MEERTHNKSSMTGCTCGICGLSHQEIMRCCEWNLLALRSSERHAFRDANGSRTKLVHWLVKRVLTHMWVASGSFQGYIIIPSLKLGQSRIRIRRWWRRRSPVSLRSCHDSSGKCDQNRR